MPSGQGDPTHQSGRAGAALTGEISPTARSLARPRSPRRPPSPRELHGARAVAYGAREASHHRAWQSDDVGGRRPAISGQEMARGMALEHRRTEVNELRARIRKKVERRGGVQERSSPVSLVGLRRAIPVDGSLTTASRGERGMHEVEALLGARCSGWR
jgi:hypothetical protein